MRAPRPLVFLLPDDRDLISGGNLYNRFLIAGCRAIGRAALVIGPGETGALSRIDDADVVVDSVLHPLVPAVREMAAPGSRLLLLLHHLPGFVPGPDATTRIAHERALLAPLDGFVATSRWTARNLRRQRGERRPILVLPPALVVAPGVPVPLPPGPPLRAALVASLIPCKGVLDLLGGLAAQVAGDDRFELTVIGRDDFDPPHAAACREVASGAPLAGRVRIRPPVPVEHMARVYARSQVVLAASRSETYGMAVAEARAFGRYVLVRRAGNLPDHVRRPAEGRVCDTVAEIAARLLDLARDPAALQLTAAAAFAARRRPCRSWNDVAARLAAGLDGLGEAARSEQLPMSWNQLRVIPSPGRDDLCHPHPGPLPRGRGR